MQNWMVLKQF